MPKPLIHFLFMFSLALFSLNAIADDEEVPKDEPTAQTQEATDTETAPKPMNDEPQQVVQDDAPANNAVEPAKDERAEAITTRIRDMVKKLDGYDRAGKEFPSKAIASALRAQFMRRMEGKSLVTWHSKKRFTPGDLTVAYDNMELFLTYSDMFMSMTMTKKVKPDDARMMAAKNIIDQCNSPKRRSRSLASLSERPDDLSFVGKAELARRKKFLGGLVGGEDYVGVQTKNVADIGKKYNETFMNASKEYERFAQNIVGAGGVPKAATEKKAAAPAPGKKAKKRK